MSALSIETDITQNVAAMKVKGKVDSDTVADLDNAFSKLLADGKNKIVLNMEGLDFMSSAGLRSLVKALKGTQGAGGDLHLASVPKSIEGLLLTVGMMQMFKMFPTHEEAAAGF